MTSLTEHHWLDRPPWTQSVVRRFLQ